MPGGDMPITGSAGIQAGETQTQNPVEVAATKEVLSSQAYNDLKDALGDKGYIIYEGKRYQADKVADFVKARVHDIRIHHALNLSAGELAEQATENVHTLARALQDKDAHRAVLSGNVITVG